MKRRVRKCKAVFSVLLYMTLAYLFVKYSRKETESQPTQPISYPKINKSRVCACPKCLTDDDPWFHELIHSAPQPFLSKDHNTSEEDFKWWKGMQRESRNITVYNSILEKLFQLIPPVPHVVGQRSDRCRTCAVVGNSGNLNGSHYGSLIDDHDIVIRMNKAPTKGYEADVGSKTTHHVMYPQSAVKVGSTTRLVFIPFNIWDLMWLETKFNPKVKSSDRIANKDLVMIFNPAFMRYIHEVWLEKKGRYPSTGFMVVALTMQICDEVNVFGFGADRDGNWNHYFEILKNKRFRTGPHAGNHEYNLIEELHRKDKIQFFLSL